MTILINGADSVISLTFKAHSKECSVSVYMQNRLYRHSVSWGKSKVFQQIFKYPLFLELTSWVYKIPFCQNSQIPCGFIERNFVCHLPCSSCAVGSPSLTSRHGLLAIQVLTGSLLV